MTTKISRNLNCAHHVATVLILLCAWSSQAAEAPYFEGKTVTVIMGLDASAGGTSVGRLLAKHLESTLEGDPTVVVKNMPGASLMKAQLYVLLKAPKDGSTIYYGPRSSLGELLELPGHTFKYTQFEALGGVQIAGLVVYARNDSVSGGMKGPSDIVNADHLLFSGMSPDHGRMIISTLGLRLLGAEYTYIPGYPSSGATRAAIMSGETNVTVDAAHAFLNQVVPGFVKNGEGQGVFSVPHYSANGELVASSLVLDVPSLPVLYEQINGQAPAGPVWDAIVSLIRIDQTMQHVFLGPPGMNQAAAAELRAALMDAFVTESFRQEARKMLSFVPQPVDHERAIDILKSTADVSPEVLQLLRNHIETNSRY